MSVWFKRVFLGIAVLGLLAAAPAGAQDEPLDMGMADAMMPLELGQPVPGQYIVVLNDDVSNVRGAAAEMARAHGLGLQFIYTNALKGFAASVPEGRLAALERDPRIAYIEQDQVGGIEGRLIAGIDRVNADEVTSPHPVTGTATTIIDGVDDLWVDVDVAVIDTGIQIDHQDLNVAGSVNCTDGGPMAPTCEAGTGGDMHWHGTHVGGTIGALDNGHDAYYYSESIDVVGVATGARLWSVRVLDKRGSGWVSQYIAGADWVAANAGTIEVANSSLGYPSSQAICDAVDALAAAGVTHTVSAGNEDSEVFKSPGNCGASVITTSAMADYDGEPGGLGLPTCSSDPDDTRASFSNYGPLVDITGPGVCVVSTSTDSWYSVASGTSMSAPHAAGAAALLAASGMTDPATIKSTLQSTGNTNSLADGGWDDDSGDNTREPLLDVTHSDFTPDTVVAGGGGGTVNASPSADFSYICSGLTCDFTDQSSDSDGTVVAWDWDFGDGATSTEQNPSHPFAAYDVENTVTLTVTDDDGATGQTSQSFTLTEEVASDVAVDGISPDAMDAGTTIDVTVTGSGFQSDAVLTFTGGGGSKPTASGVQVSGDGLSLTASVSANLMGKTGVFVFDAVVTNGDGSTGTKSGAFTLTR